MRRARRRVTTLALLVGLLAGTTAAPARAADPVFPRPGGGPRAIDVYSDQWALRSYVLDRTTGDYRALPYHSVRVSPDGRTLAVENLDGDIGLANRRTPTSVRWTSLPRGSFGGWSPDGRALLTTTLDKDTWTFAAHRYDVRTGSLRATPIRLDCEVCTAGWAADSRRYTVMLGSGRGPATYLDPDGSAGPPVGADGLIGSATAYSPSRRSVIVEPPFPLPPGEPIDWHQATILDLRTGATTRIRSGWPLLGWYDERRVVRIAPEEESTVLEVVDVRTGKVVRRVPAPALQPYFLQLGRGTADLGF